MSKNNLDIKDDEIRIISSLNKLVKREEENRCAEPQSVEPASDVPTVYVNSRKRIWILPAVFICIAVCIVLALYFLFFSPHAPQSGQSEMKVSKVAETPISINDAEIPPSFAVCTDTIVNGVKLRFLTPHNSTPTLEIGNETVNDTTIILAVQAADVRGYNGKIAGAFVVNGELVSKGEAKAGFCSIVNGEITIGVADATPMLEEALTTGGYFFRQYPLVAGGQIVENKPRGKAIRKALAETREGISVVISDSRMTFHDFSQALVDAGVRNAIYLVGANSLGCYKDSEGRRFPFGKKWDNNMENVNYIVWR